MFATVKLRRRKSRSGSIGWDVRRSQRTKAPSRITPPPSVPQIAGLLQPSRRCSISANAVPPRPSTQSAAPTRSTRARPPGSRAGTATRISAIVAAASGTLIRKIHRHEPIASSSPPASGPITIAMPLHAVQVPIAALRSSPSNVVTITASALGVSSAPAMPWTPRAAISSGALGAAAHRIEATPKAPTPTAKTRRSPKMSPSEPPTRISEPSVSR